MSHFTYLSRATKPHKSNQLARLYTIYTHHEHHTISVASPTFPEPLSPTRATSLPGSNFRLTPLSATLLGREGYLELDAGTLLTCKSRGVEHLFGSLTYILKS